MAQAIGDVAGRGSPHGGICVSEETTCRAIEDVRRCLEDLMRASGIPPDSEMLDEFSARIDALYSQHAAETDAAIDGWHPTILDVLAQQIFLVDAEDRVTRANRAARQVLGDGIAGMDLSRVMQRAAIRSPDGRPLGKKELPGCRTLPEEETAGMRVLITDRQGKTKSMLASASPLISGGEQIGSVVGLQDITDLAAAETERRHLLRQMRAATADLLELSADLDRERQNLTRILSSLPDRVMIIDADGRLSYANPPAARYIGRKPEEIAGRTWQELGMPPEVMEGVMAAVRSVFASGGQASGEACHVRADGVLHFEYIATPLPGADGGIAAALATFRDVSDRRRLESALSDAEKKYRPLFERMREAVYILQVVRDGDGNPIDYRYLDLNRQGEAALGRAAAELAGMSVHDVYGELEEPLSGLMNAVARSGEPGHTEFYSHALGQYLEVTAYSPEANRLALISSDITARKLAEEGLQASEEKFRTIAQRSFDVIATSDPEGRITYVSPAVERALGYAPEELIGTCLQEIILPSSQRAFRQAHDAVLEGKEAECLQLEVRKKDGGPAVLEVNCSPIAAGGAIAGTQCTGRDITERMRVEAALRDAARRMQDLEFIVNSSPAIAFRCRASPGLPVEFISENVAVFGYSPEEFTGGHLSLRDIAHPDDRGRIDADTLHTPQDDRDVFAFQYRIFTCSGEVRWVEERTWMRRDEGGAVSCYQGIIMDITERKALDAAKQQAYERIEQNIEQFAILGDHIRHPLQVILAQADLMEDEATAEKIHEQVRRIDALVKRLDQGWIESRKIREYLQRND
ncbi:hypothetical protein ASZ90_010850 [hydrocarbon metagenome]|uniref:histidine kinase n=1 Tax=hydrocarbon metagenome TaxID=938273 RepID=A0A0W8FEV7_9ZZZZ